MRGNEGCGAPVVMCRRGWSGVRRCVSFWEKFGVGFFWRRKGVVGEGMVGWVVLCGLR